MATKVKSERFELRIDEGQLCRIEKWINEQPAHLTKAEAVRRLIDIALSSGSSQSVNFSDGERALIFMVADIQKALKIQNTDAEFLEDVIQGGHYWAPKWDMGHIFHDYADKPNEVRYVVDVLDMWSFIEEAYESLSPEDKSLLQAELGARPTDLKFHGFDGNNEIEQVNIATFLIEKMGRFKRFDPNKLNAHCPTYERYTGMLRVFDPIRASLIGVKLSVSQLIKIFK